MAVLTRGLAALRTQVNAAFPQRDKTSDGWIGDAEHERHTSGHNPDDKAGSKAAWNGDPDSKQEVRAWDCDNDFGPGVDPADVVDHLRRLPGLDDHIRYMIHKGRIYHSRTGYASDPYPGAYHGEHIHFEGAWSQTADESTSFNYRLSEVPVSMTAADKAWMQDRIDAAADRAAAAAIAGVKGWTEPNDLDLDPVTKKPRPGRIGSWIRLMESRAEKRHKEVMAALKSIADTLAGRQ